MLKSSWFILLAALILIVILYAVMRYRRSGESAGGDALVLAQLKESGADLSKPHAIEFFLAFPSEQVAREAAGQIQSKGFDAKVERAGDGPAWLCLATKSMVPDLETLRGIRSDFDRIAQSLGGEYDGWGTPVVE